MKIIIQKETLDNCPYMSEYYSAVCEDPIYYPAIGWGPTPEHATEKLYEKIFLLGLDNGSGLLYSSSIN